MRLKLAYALQAKGLLSGKALPQRPRAATFKPRHERNGRTVVAEHDGLRAVVDKEDVSFGVQWHWTVEHGDELVEWGKGSNYLIAMERAVKRFNEQIKDQNIRFSARKPRTQIVV